MLRLSQQRILLISHDAKVQKEFRHLFAPKAADKHIVFKKKVHSAHFELNTVYEGSDALSLVKQSVIQENPFALIFMLLDNQVIESIDRKDQSTSVIDYNIIRKEPRIF